MTQFPIYANQKTVYYYNCLVRNISNTIKSKDGCSLVLLLGGRGYMYVTHNKPHHKLETDPKKNFFIV